MNQTKASIDLTVPDWWTDSALLSHPPRKLHTEGKCDAILVAALSQSGQELAFSSGQPALIDELSRHCARPVSKWHFVPEPVLTQGNDHTIESLITNRHENSRPSQPEEWSYIKYDDRLEYLLYISPGLRWFEDHFPGNPILPGVVQIHWAIKMAAELGFDAHQFTALSRVKFTAVITPDAMIRLSLSKVGTKLRFSYQSRTGSHSMGTVCFSEPPF